jgi:hypothetical protein
MSAACSWILERILQAFFATQVGAFVYFMAVILVEMEKLFRLGAIYFRSRRMQGAALRGEESSASESDRNTRALPCLFPAAFLVLAGRSGSGDLRGFAILALQPAWARFDHSPMRPGAE